MNDIDTYLKIVKLTCLLELENLKLRSIEF